MSCFLLSRGCSLGSGVGNGGQPGTPPRGRLEIGQQREASCGGFSRAGSTEGQYLCSSWAGAVCHCLRPLTFRPSHPYLRNALIDMGTTPGIGSGVLNPHPHSQAETGGPEGKRVRGLGVGRPVSPQGEPPASHLAVKGEVRRIMPAVCPSAPLREIPTKQTPLSVSWLPRRA